MRTTLDIDDDVLSAAKDLARAEGRTVGEVISDLARRALTQPTYGGLAEAPARFDAGGFPMLPQRGGPPGTSELVRQLQEEVDLEDASAFDHSRGRPRAFSGPLSETPGKAKGPKKAPR